MLTHPIHPVVVHFPIALLFTSVLFDVIGFRSRRESFREGALWLLILGLLGGVAGAITGDWAEEAAQKAGIADSLIETYETLAVVTLGIFGVHLLGRLVMRNRLTLKTALPYFLVSALGFGTLSLTGYLSGDLVFKHGAGVGVTHGIFPGKGPLSTGHQDPGSD